MWLNLLINIGLYAFKEYSKTTDTTQDDKILEAVKVGACYLAPKSNNTLTPEIRTDIQQTFMKQTQRSR
jgi:hypothetical protein